MNSFFKLIEQFRTQDEPAFCGLASVAMVLNALSIDPRRAWKGPWRWFHEEMLDCCLPLGVVRANGVTLEQAACLARCNGAAVEVYQQDGVSLEAFREMIADATASATEHVIVSYSRRAFGQTGDGHFSPVGGYSRMHDMVLILDTARFKYPPHWVPLPALHAAMAPIDKATGRPRGFMRLGSRPLLDSALFTLDVRDRAAAAEALAWMREGVPAAVLRAKAEDAERERRAAKMHRLAASNGGSAGGATAASGAPDALAFEDRDGPFAAETARRALELAAASAPVGAARRFLAARAAEALHASLCCSRGSRHAKAPCTQSGAVDTLLSELRGTEAFAVALERVEAADAERRRAKAGAVEGIETDNRSAGVGFAGAGAGAAAKLPRATPDGTLVVTSTASSPSFSSSSSSSSSSLASLELSPAEMEEATEAARSPDLDAERLALLLLLVPDEAWGGLAGPGDEPLLETLKVLGIELRYLSAQLKQLGALMGADAAVPWLGDAASRAPGAAGSRASRGGVSSLSPARVPSHRLSLEDAVATAHLTAVDLAHRVAEVDRSRLEAAAQTAERAREGAEAVAALKALELAHKAAASSALAAKAAKAGAAAWMGDDADAEELDREPETALASATAKDATSTSAWSPAPALAAAFQAQPTAVSPRLVAAAVHSTAAAPTAGATDARPFGKLRPVSPTGARAGFATAAPARAAASPAPHVRELAPRATAFDAVPATGVGEDASRAAHAQPLVPAPASAAAARAGLPAEAPRQRRRPCDACAACGAGPCPSSGSPRAIGAINAGVGDVRAFGGL